jgi:anaerobic ribonucleoside-triphosphate reductase activating protein
MRNEDIFLNNPKPKEWLASELSQNYYADYKPLNFVDGEGIRNSLYVSGCLFACEGCFNQAVQSFKYGKPFTEELLHQIIEDSRPTHIKGLTLLGGEPFLNTQVCLTVVHKFREEFGQTKDIWSWSGYTFEELLQDSADKLELLHNIDILVDGRFKLEEKDWRLQFRGSRNQRIVDVQKSLAAGEVVLWDKINDAKEKFEQIKGQDLI